jgi:hypothetical protein
LKRWAYRILPLLGLACIAGAIFIAKNPERLAIDQGTAVWIALGVIVAGLIPTHIALRNQLASIPPDKRKPLTPAAEKHATRVTVLIFAIPIAIACGATIAPSRGVEAAIKFGLLGGLVAALAGYFFTRIMLRLFNQDSKRPE